MSPSATESPAAKYRSTSRPGAGARTSCSIFMASTTSNTSPPGHGVTGLDQPLDNLGLQGRANIHHPAIFARPAPAGNYQWRRARARSRIWCMRPIGAVFWCTSVPLAVRVSTDLVG
jgi:hypothetical protein